MIDRFKFRMYNKNTNWYIGSNNDQLFDAFNVGSPMLRGSVDEVVMEQCTGLKDKNGVLIFEGDKVLSPTEYNAQHEETIVFDTDTASFWWGGFCISRAVSNGCEITGNIHD